MADLDVQRAVSKGTCAFCTAGQRVTSGQRCGSCAKTSSTNRYLFCNMKHANTACLEYDLQYEKYIDISDLW